MTKMQVVGKSSFPLLGGKGELPSTSSELMSAPEEEDDFDILNDETFGDGVDEHFDWEEEHERMAEELDSFSDSRQNGNKTKDSGFDTAEKSYRSQEEYLEQSISQLVVDDEEDLEDPAILNASRNRPIPQSHKARLEDLFGPSSPPAFLDTEHLVSPSSKDIWRYSRAEEALNKQRNNKQSNYKIPTIIERRNIIPQSPMIPPQAHTLEEIEKRMMSKPRVVTAEELERQMRGETTPSAKASAMMMQGQRYTTPVQIPPQPIISPLSHASPYHRHVQAPHGFSPITQMYPDGRNSPLHQILASGRITPTGNMSPIPHRQSPVFGMTSNSPLGRSITPPHPLRMSPLSHSPLQNHIMTNINQHQSVMLANAMTQNRNFSNTGNVPQVRGQGQYGSQNGPRGNHPYPDRYGNQSSPARPYNKNHQRFQGPSYNRDYYYRPSHEQPRDGRSTDDFAGLMTQKEKDWIIKIQLMQLQTENPYIDDYYYTNFTINKKNKELRRQQEVNGVTTEEQQLLIPHLVKIEQKTYSPAQFEGSLGRLTTASVHNPRQIINITRRASIGGEEGQNVSKELRKIRQLLMDIEKGYNILLDIDDLEKQVLALTPESRKPLNEARKEKIVNLLEYFTHSDNPDNFLQIISVRKGRKLLSRVLPLLDTSQTEVLMSIILSYLPNLAKKDSEEGTGQLCESITRAIATCNLNMLVKFAGQIQKEYHEEQSLKLVFQSKLGCTLLCCMLKQGEVIYQNTSPVDMDNQLQTSWCNFVEKFVESLASVSVESIATPICLQPNLAKHLDRFINKKLVASVEDKLSLFTTGQS
ncbi:protein PAT1 homolog 1 isoform X1 [Patella vulgata]|uniref:protein PAT1 homolog 1 isoform X1 n=1 Tax=Patella vulgata TaxID=6465 RepID=UPI0024A9DC38|nr:protein PAT1 homolog 1 isoform X1 [Patella vulgata]